MILTARPCELVSLCAMHLKDTKLYSILNFKCPVCHEGEFFQAHPYVLSKVGDLHANCPVCGVKYEKEIGFYTGAMYVSYAIGVAVFATVWVAMGVLFPELGVGAQITTIALVMLAGSPLFYALSKIIWANLFFSFDKSRSWVADRTTVGPVQ